MSYRNTVALMEDLTECTLKLKYSYYGSFFQPNAMKHVDLVAHVTCGTSSKKIDTTGFEIEGQQPGIMLIDAFQNLFHQLGFDVRFTVDKRCVNMSMFSDVYMAKDIPLYDEFKHIEDGGIYGGYIDAEGLKEVQDAINLEFTHIAMNPNT
jgi:hypothetical protein